MKTRTQFKLATDSITIQMFDVTNQQKGYKLADLEPAKTVTYKLDELPTEFDMDSENPKSLLAYGLSQFMQDRTASLTDKTFVESGMSFDEAVAHKFEAFNELFDMLLDGRMTKERAKGEGKKASIDTFFAKAFVEFVKTKKGQDITVEQSMIILQTKLDNEARKQMRQALQSRINELKAEAQREVADFDMDSLFN